jgi:ABC-type transport system involved in multi-copper enzyme maturation permease subunit
MRAGTPIAVPQFPRSFSLATHAHQMLVIAWTSFRTIATSWAGLTLLVALPLLTVPVVVDQMQSGGVPLVPTTAYVIRELTGSLSDELSRWVIIPFLIVFFAGELVWREREARLGEITDAMPGSEWAPLLGKFLGLGLMLVLFLSLQSVAGMLAQVILGYNDFEIGLYLKIMLGLQLTEYLLFALLALVVHVLVDQKYVGHLVAIITFVFIAMAITAHRGGAAALGTRQGKRPAGAAPTSAPSFHRCYQLDCSRCCWAYLYIGRIYLLQHKHAERVPDRLRNKRAAGRVRAALRTVRSYSSTLGYSYQAAHGDLS